MAGNPRLISRDPFARTELWCREVKPGASTCSWCGQRNGRDNLFEYWNEKDDSSRKNWLKGRFCSVSCMRSYHDL